MDKLSAPTDAQLHTGLVPPLDWTLAVWSNVLISIKYNVGFYNRGNPNYEIVRESSIVAFERKQ